MEEKSSQDPNMDATIGVHSNRTFALPDRTKQSKPRKEKAPKSQKDSSNSKLSKNPKNKAESAAKPTPTDPDAMFKVGFLADVYNERPAEKVVTRCTFPEC